jgi:hypothetical protein
MSIQDRKNEFLLWDVLIIIVSVAVALALSQTGILMSLLASAAGWQLVGSFVAGLFFTSVFTTAPAIVALGEISLVHPLLSVALFGAIGAVVGDLIIFRFVRDRFSEHVLTLVGHRSLGKRVQALLKLRLFRWVSFFVGGLVIASPLPDELGISLLGFSKLTTQSFIVLSFSFNFVGIVLIGLVAQSL